MGIVCSLRCAALLLALIACAGVASTASAAPGFRDTVLSPTAERSPQATAEWGGATVASNGETVTIYLSDSYPVDPTVAKQWADYVTSLLHGPEIATVTIHLAPRADIQQRCGGQALACYSPSLASIWAPADDPAVQTSAKGVLAHEYGHHVAANRTNPPFTSVDYGTKRWASYQDICSRTEAGVLYPGAEDVRHYSLNPGEAFAETYRVLNEQRLGLPQEAWSVVTTLLYPDAAALSLLEQDVLTPWTANTARIVSVKLNAKTRTRTVALSTPYDGTLTIVPRQSGSAKVSVALLAQGAAVDTGSFRRARGASLSTTVCGQRSYSVRVKLTGAVTKTTRTTVALSLSTP
jgi:hypothetical protein